MDPSDAIYVADGTKQLTFTLLRVVSSTTCESPRVAVFAGTVGHFGRSGAVHGSQGRAARESGHIGSLRDVGFV